MTQRVLSERPHPVRLDVAAYVLASVLFAAVLFFTGIVTKFRNDGIRFGSLAMASVALVGATAFMLMLPKIFQA